MNGNELFALAEEVAKGLPDASVSNADKLELYAHQQQATLGPCTTERPGFFDRSGRAKWQAWARLKSMETDVAKKMYCEIIDALVPGWRSQARLGAEASELDGLFDIAQLAARQADEAGKLGIAARLSLYGHYQQATEGPVQGHRPGMSDMVGRAMYDAWAARGSMSKREAKHMFIDLADEHLPGWRERAAANHGILFPEAFEQPAPCSTEDEACSNVQNVAYRKTPIWELVRTYTSTLVFGTDDDDITWLRSLESDSEHMQLGEEATTSANIPPEVDHAEARMQEAMRNVTGRGRGYLQARSQAIEAVSDEVAKTRQAVHDVADVEGLLAPLLAVPLQPSLLVSAG